MLVLALTALADPVDSPLEEVPPWVGRVVNVVTLSAPGEGALPREDLEPLLRVKQGEPLDPRAIASDVSTLFQVGGFEAVEADVELWEQVDPESGNPTSEAIVNYRLYPAPRLERIRVRGGTPQSPARQRGVSELQVIDASGLQRGQLFFGDVDGPYVEESLRGWLAEKGYADGRVQVLTTEPRAGEIWLDLWVDAGAPTTLAAVQFVGAGVDDPQLQRRLRRWARRAGVQAGKPLGADAVADAQASLREELGRLRGGLFGARSAWVAARVSWLRSEDDTLTYSVELGQELTLSVRGLGRGGARLVETTLGVDHRIRINRSFLDQAPGRIEAVLQERGWLEAHVEVALDDGVLSVNADRGPRHTMGDIPPDYVVTFTDVPDRKEARREQTELQALFDQASPEILRRDYYSEEAMGRAIAAAEQRYLDRGYLDVQLERLEPDIEERPSPANAFRRLVGQPPTMTLTPQVRVTRGQITTLAELSVDGVPDDLQGSMGFVEEAIAEREERRYSPQETDELARRMVETARASGYLEADARVETAQGDADHTLRAKITLTPGPRILLRSLVTHGLTYTRPEFVMNQLGLVRGEPLTSTAIEAARQQLYELGTFRTVGIDLVGDEEARDLIVRLDEAPRYEFEPRFGFSTDQGIRAAGRFTRRNLLGRAHSFDVFGQIGYSYRSADVTDWLPDWSRPEFRGALRYTAPRFPTPGQRLEVDVVIRERRQERTWMMDRSGGGVALETTFGRSRLRVGGRVETRRLAEVDRYSLLADEPWQALLAAEATPDRVQEAVFGLFVHDWQDSRAVLSVSGEWVPGIDWSGFGIEQPRTSYLKGEANFSFYVPLGDLELHLAGRGGGITSFAGIVPLEDRFRLGGTGSLRGFVRDAVGPHNVAQRSGVAFPDVLGPIIANANRDQPQPWTPTGGDAMGALTSELLVPLPSLGLTNWEGYAAEVFADVGNVWLLDPNATVDSAQASVSDLVPAVRVGVGVGLRWETPLGPLQFDVAANPQVLLASEERRALLADQWGEGPARLHLTLGALF